MKRTLFVALALAPAVLSGSVWAQQGTFPAPGGGGLSASGAITATDCVKWTSATTIADAGGPCGGTGAPGGSSGQFQYNNAGSFGGYAPSAALGALGAEPTATPAYVSGFWYLPPYVTLGGGSTLTSGRIALIPMICPTAMTVAALGARVVTAAAGNAQLAVYANNPATGRPTGAPLAYTASISVATAGTVSGTPVGGAFTLPAGIYWDAVNVDSGANATVTFTALNSGAGTAGYIVGSATQSNISDSAATGRLEVYYAAAYGAWPSLTGVTFNESATTANAVIELKSQ